MNKKISERGVVARYLIFGIFTTVVGWVSYFSVLIGGKAIFSIPPEDTTSAAYMGVYTVAQVIQWIAAVIFAFYTNKKWVFNNNKNSDSTLKQFGIFASGRIVTFFVDYGVTFFGALAFSMAMPFFNSVAIFGHEININEITAKLIAAIIVVVSNYFFSKLLVFRKKCDCEEQKKQDHEDR